EKSTLIGIILGFAALLVGMIFKGANPMAIVQNPAAIVIIMVGTVACIGIGFPGSDLKSIPKLFKLIFFPQKLVPKTEIIRLFMEWASITRREGLLALESKVKEIDDSFLRKGRRIIIDGNDQDFVRDV